MTPRPELTSKAVADLVGGRLVGSGEVRLQGIRALESAGPGELSFLVSTRYLPYFRASQAGAVLISEVMATEAGGPAVRVIVPDVQRALEQALLAFHPPRVPVKGVDPSARVDGSATLGSGVSIGPQVIVGEGARIGDRSRLAAGVVVGEDVVIGNDCVIDERVICCPGAVVGDRVRLKAGAVIAGQGFGYASDARGHHKLPHVGRCVLEDDVEVGSNSCIDRGTLEDTVIGRGTKIDNLVQIGHNCRIGEHCLIMATTGIAGSVRIGAGVIVAGGVGIRDHARIGAGARLAAKSGIFGDVAEGATVGGYPARPHREFLRAQAALYALAPHAAALTNLLAERGARGPSND
ncbi:MAG TPA: UDP-3-O-(3-hydroxymyristoyl)glucosamine N-acyltransferase [Gemmatimonadales bacterium]|nr:UDP-3-O-(3-hydroxymyristoyl)glucosamine N-acyltransferase [Gemmatimonadales bacterium]